MKKIKLDIDQCVNLALNYIVEHEKDILYCRPVWEEYDDPSGKLLGIEVGYRDATVL